MNLNFNQRKILVICILATLCLSTASAENSKKISEWELSADEISLFGEPIKAFDFTKFSSEEKIKYELGKKLYFETKLSSNNLVSCNSCHNLLNGSGVDHLKTSKGVIDGKIGDRNSPTTLNAFTHVAQFWDGRASDVEAQALGPIMNPIEMGMPSEKAVVEKIKAIPEYVNLFKKSFSKEQDALTYQNIGNSIGFFERTLTTPSRFDDYLAGQKNALTEIEKKGAKKFITLGCIGCHDGPNLGGNQFQKIGLIEEYDTKDLGRFNLTKEESDKKVFKVPGLRNISRTAPYFHDGSIESLEDVITLMAKHQLGIVWKGTQERDELAAFLKSLDGKFVSGFENKK